MTGLTACVTLLAPRAAARFGPRVPIAVGQFLIVVGLLALAVSVALQAPVLLLALLTIPVGFGSALAIPTTTALLVGSVPADRAGAASGVLNTCRQLGGALAVAVFGALVAHPERFCPGHATQSRHCCSAAARHHRGQPATPWKRCSRMTAWTADELSRIGTADELRLTSSRKDGTQGKPVTIWVVRAGDDLYARAFKGRSSPWFRGTQVRHQGHIQAGGVRKDVELLDPEPSVADALDAEYRSKYRRHGSPHVDPMVSPQAREATLK